MSPSCHAPRPLANRHIYEGVSPRRFTRYGGFDALSDFVAAQWIDQALADAFGREKAPWGTSSPSETLRHLLDGYLLGLERAGYYLGCHGKQRDIYVNSATGADAAVPRHIELEDSLCRQIRRDPGLSEAER